MDNTAQESLDNLMKNLTTKQRAFLNARKSTDTDIAAVEEVGIAASTVSRWKNDKPFFLEAYDIVTGTSEPDSLVISSERMMTLREEQLQSMKAVLPEVIKEHISLALSAQSESVRLRAIHSIEEMTGVDNRESLKSMLQGRGTFVELVQILRPQIEKSRDDDADALEADYWDLGELDDA